MKIATFTQLRNNAKKYFDEVEEGETIEIYRHGKPIAILSPLRSAASSRWKEANPRVLSGVSLSQAILQERRESR